MQPLTPVQFSIVIPTLNEEKYLPNLLQDLSEQTLTNFEVIVVDGNSDDKTVKKAKEYQNKLKITVLSVKKRNLAYQRNQGAQATHSQWILFLDADDRIPPFFLQGIRYQLDKHPNTDIFTTWIAPESKVITDVAIAQTFNLNLEVNYLIKNYCTFGACIGVRKTVLSTNKFDETTKAIEDTVFVRDVTKNGFVYKIFKEPQYIFSLRRIRKDGTLKSLRITAITQLRLLQGERTFGDHIDYPMLGGTTHDTIDEHSEQNILSLISRLPKQQLKKVKIILDKIEKFFLE